MRTQSGSNIVSALSGTTGLLLRCAFSVVNVSCLVLRREDTGRGFRAPTAIWVAGALLSAFLVGLGRATPRLHPVPDRAGTAGDRHHNALYDQARPAEGARTVVMVGDQLSRVRSLFASCEVRTGPDDGVGVDNEEQDVPVAVCREPVQAW